MSTQDQMFCKSCQKQVLVTKEKTSHLLHLILSALTFGFWLIVWLLVAISGTWRCSVCGSSSVRKPVSVVVVVFLAITALALGMQYIN